MDASSWLSDLLHVSRLVIGAAPDAFWLAYYWLRDWQGLVGGVLVLFAAEIFSRRSLRAARIRATAMIRAAQIGAATRQSSGVPAASAPPFLRSSPLPMPTVSDALLAQKVEQLRSLVRSAMSTLTSDAQQGALAPNIFCQRILQMSFKDADVPVQLEPVALQTYQKLQALLDGFRALIERNATHAEVSQALVQLNASARALTAALATPHLIFPNSDRIERSS